MSDWVLFVLFELLAVVGGVFGTLIGFGVMGRTGADPAAYQRWYEQAGWRLRWLGPMMLLVAASLPVAFGVAPSTPWAEHLVGWSLFVGFAVVVVVTWKREPAVGWPVGALAWLGFAVASLTLGGVVAGLAESVGLDVSLHRAWVLPGSLVAGAVLARVLSVWSARQRTSE